MCWGLDLINSPMVPEGERFVSISAGQDHNCGLREDGSAVCWGGNGGLSICTPDAGGYYSCRTPGAGRDLSPSPPPGELLASLSDEPNCGLTADGKAVCWTAYESGLLPVPESERFTSISSSSQARLRPAPRRHRRMLGSEPSWAGLTAFPESTQPTNSPTSKTRRISFPSAGGALIPVRLTRMEK